MSIDPSEFFSMLGKLQSEVQEEHSKADYYLQKLKIRMADFQAECQNPHATPEELDIIRNGAQEKLDSYLDAVQSVRQIADKFRNENL